MSNGNNSLSFNELELTKPYLYDLINVYKAKGEWKISVEISFVSQKPGSDENHVMYTRSTPEEFIIGGETEVAEKLFMSILQKYQDNLQNKMKGSDFYSMELIIYTMILIIIKVEYRISKTRIKNV